MKILKRLVKLGGVSLLFLLAYLSTNSQSASAACGRSGSGMNSPADVRVHVHNNTGSAMNNISFDFFEVDGYTSLWQFDGDGNYVDGSATSSHNYTSGDTCAGSGTVVLAYLGNGGNGWSLGCTQRTDATGPSGGGTGRPSNWSFRNITMPGAGSWNIPTFQVVNGATTDVDLVWNPDAPPPGDQGVQGRVYNDANDNRQYDSGEQIIQNPSGACPGSYLTVGATVSAGGTTGNLNVCNPDPLFKIATSPGAQRVTLNVPGGWTATNGTYRDVTVPSGSYYSFSYAEWFGIKQNPGEPPPPPPPPPGLQYVVTRVFNDLDGNGQYNNNEPIIQNSSPSPNCSDTVNQGLNGVAVALEGGGSTSPNQCNGPIPGFGKSGGTVALIQFSTSPGNHRLTITGVPSGWVTTNTTSRVFNVPAGTTSNPGYGGPSSVNEYFGIKQNAVVVPNVVATSDCSNTSPKYPIANISWTADSGNYYVNIDDSADFGNNPSFGYWDKSAGTATSANNAPSGFNNSGTPVPADSLVPGMTYYVRVLYVNQNVYASTSFAARGDCTPPPPAPTHTVSCDTTTGSITATLSWTAGTGGSNFRAEIGQGNTIPAAYFAKAVSGAPGTSVPVGFDPAGTTPAGSVLTLTQNTNYTYRIIYNNGSYGGKTAGPTTFNTGPCSGTPPYDNIINLGGGATCQSVLQNSDFEIFPVDARNRGAGSSPSIIVEVDGGHDGAPGGPASAWITANTVDTTGTPTVLSSPTRYQWSAGSPPPGNVPFFSEHAWWHVGAAPVGTTIYFNGKVSPGKGIDSGVTTDAFHDATYGGGILPCITVVSTTSPFFTTRGSDVHAGGSAGSGSSCTLSVAGTGNIRGQVNQDGGSPADYPTKVEYVVSAHGNINNIGRDALQFSNIPFAPGPGHYGSVCRPDLVNLAIKYPAASTSTYVPGTSNLGGTRANDTMFKHVGDLILTSPVTVAGRVTLFVQGNVTIKGNINFNAGPWAWSPDPASNNLPALGIIATGDINIDPAVTHLDGYFFAGGAGGPGGVFDTCAGVVISGPGATASACSNDLVLNGLVMASRFRLARTKGTTVPGASPAETFNFLGDIYLTPPPVFRDGFTPRATGLQFQGELPPLY